MNTVLREQMMQQLNRITHATKEMKKSQNNADALKRQYHRAVFEFLYGQNQPRNYLTKPEVNASIHHITRATMKKAQNKADALKRQYHRAVFLFLYGQNQHRNYLTTAEVAQMRAIIPRIQRGLATTRDRRIAMRFLSTTILNNNSVRRIMNMA